MLSHANTMPIDRPPTPCPDATLSVVPVVELHDVMDAVLDLLALVECIADRLGLDLEDLS